MTNFTVFLVLITIVCFLLIIAVMVQNPKGGGLSSSFGGSQMLGGVQKTNDFLTTSTWVLAGALIVLILLSSLSFPGMMGGSDSKIIDEKAPAEVTKPTPAAQKPAAPATTPEKK